MKNFAIKSVVCIALSAVLAAGIFTGCGREKEAQDNTSLTLTSQESASTPTVTDDRSDEPIIADENDLKDFHSLITNIVNFRNSMMLDIKYSSTDENKMTYAMECVFNIWGSVWEYCEEKYNWQDSYKSYWSNTFDEVKQKWIFETPDPLEQVKGYAYVRLDGDKVDWILKNIMNTEPDHSYNSKNVKLSEYEMGFACYYYDGYYYYSTGDGGDAGFQTKIDSKSVNENGQYVFDISGYDFNDEKIASYNVVAELHEVDGSREWKLISIS